MTKFQSCNGTDLITQSEEINENFSSKLTFKRSSFFLSVFIWFYFNSFYFSVVLNKSWISLKGHLQLQLFGELLRKHYQILMILVN
jgi:hypothetical protein